MTREDYRDETGAVRLLLRTEPDQNSKLMRASMTSFTQWLDQQGLGLIPRDKWVEFDSEAVFANPDFMLDQSHYGACVGYSCAHATMRQRAMRGLDYVRLSGAYVYDQINNGRDRGACITDSEDVMSRIGTCLESEYMHPVMNRTLQPASLGKYKLTKSFVCTTFDEIGTALSMRYQVQFPIMVGDNWDRYDQNGCVGFTSGSGNHSVCGDGLKFVNGIWIVKIPNTWTMNRGVNKNGYDFCTERHIKGAACPDDAYVHMNEAG